MEQTKWVRCPICGNKTRDKIREDTVLMNFPLYCPKCKQETLIEVRNLQIFRGCLFYVFARKNHRRT